LQQALTYERANLMSRHGIADGVKHQEQFDNGQVASRRVSGIVLQFVHQHPGELVNGR
jgi:hypothetical protein